VLIQQVLINLLENAAKYTPEGAPIEIGASAGNGGVTIEVADRGPGVPAAEHARIFEKFQRGHSERTKGGVGLGLAICRAIVVAHGGRIWVEDREGGGARFLFALPVHGKPSAQPLPEIQEAAEPARPAE
jgi:two-component system sensor histidine kinase KdpD